MPRARGADALMARGYEVTYGDPDSVSEWVQVPFISSNLGAEQGVIADDTLGHGREAGDPSEDVIANVGDVVVPVDDVYFGYWLKDLFGDPETEAFGAASGSIVFSAQPAATKTVTVNGTAFTFVAGSPSGNQVELGANLAATMTNLAAALNASGVSGVGQATYTAAADRVNIVHDTAGPAGNAFTLAAGAGSNATVSGATLTGGTNRHTFLSGAYDLPSASIELIHPRVPAASVNFGCRANALRIGLTRRGLLAATISLIGQGETDLAADPVSTGLQEPEYRRFAQAKGEITRDGASFKAQTADLSLTNNAEAVEVIRPDGMIEDVDPGVFTGSVGARIYFEDRALAAAFAGGNPYAQTVGWTLPGGASLTFTLPRVFPPRKTKRAIQGPGHVMVDVTGTPVMDPDLGYTVKVELENTVSSYP